MLSQERVIGVVSVIAAVILWYLAAGLPSIPTHGDVGPAFFPRVIASLFLILGVLFLAIGPRLRPKAAETVSISRNDILRAGLLLVLTITYVAAQETLGFVLATAAYLFAGRFVFGSRKWLSTAVFAILCAVLLYLVFKTWLHVPLPDWDSLLNIIPGYAVD